MLLTWLLVSSFRVLRKAWDDAGQAEATGFALASRRFAATSFNSSLQIGLQKKTQIKVGIFKVPAASLSVADPPARSKGQVADRPAKPKGHDHTQS